MVHASAARAALENLASGLAIEWSRHRIRAVCVATGAIDTDAFRLRRRVRRGGDADGAARTHRLARGGRERHRVPLVPGRRPTSPGPRSWSTAGTTRGVSASPAAARSVDDHRTRLLPGLEPVEGLVDRSIDRPGDHRLEPQLAELHQMSEQREVSRRHDAPVPRTRHRELLGRGPRASSGARASGGAIPTRTVVPPGATERIACSIVSVRPRHSNAWSKPPGIRSRPESTVSVAPRSSASRSLTPPRPPPRSGMRRRYGRPGSRARPRRSRSRAPSRRGVPSPCSAPRPPRS